MSAPRLMSPRPMNSRGKWRRGPSTAFSGSRYFAVEIDRVMRCAQAQPRHDDLRAHAAVRRLGERERVRQLAPKIQPAHERVDLADGGPFRRSQALRQRAAGVLSQQKPGALARGIGGGEQEDLV